MTNEELEGLDLDEVFFNPENPVRVVQPEPTAVVTPEPAQPIQAAEPFLKTRTGTVYKNADDAAQGIEHKDQLIARLRQEAIDRSGTDPITGQQVVKAPEPPKSYAQDHKRFIADLSKAATENDSEAYVRVQTQLINDTLAPFAPVLANLAKNQAVESVTAKNPQFREFRNSTEYTETLEKFPLLAGAITQSEGDPQAQSNLEQFYQMTFELASARKVPEVVRAQAQSIPRPTVSSTTLPSLPTTSTTSATPGLGSSEARKALIEQQERSGVLNMRM